MTFILHPNPNAATDLLADLQSRKPTPDVCRAFPWSWFNEHGDAVLQIARENNKSLFVTDEIRGHAVISHIRPLPFGYYFIWAMRDGHAFQVQNSIHDPATVERLGFQRE